MKKLTVKRVMAVFLLILLVVGGAAGCGNKEPGASESQPQESLSESDDSSNANTEEDASQEIGGDRSSESEAGGQESDGTAEAGGESGEVPILKDAVENYIGCFIGTAVTGSEIDDEKLWELVTTHFNAVTLGNELKPDCMFGYSNGSCPGTEEAELNGETIVVPKMDYSRAERILDKILAWNTENPDNQLKVRGHVLVWHSQTPEWFFHEDYDKNKDYVDKDTMNKRLEWYIRTMLTHFTGEDSKYKDMFYGWDVVNEAISDGTGTYRSDNENPNEPLSNDTHGSNSSWWHVYQSNEFIINAFTYANKYAPETLELYYNDYNECSTQKMQGIQALLTAVKEREGEPGVGTRITAMGMQGHYGMSSPLFSDMQLAVKRYAAIVGNVQITEFDIKASSDYDGSDEAKETEYEKQANRYGVLYWALKAMNDQDGINVTGINFWGTVDHYSWLQSRSDVGGGADGRLPQCPLLFDEYYQPKPAFYAFIKEE